MPRPTRILPPMLLLLTLAPILRAAPPKPDTSTPKSTVKYAFDLIAAGDIETLKSLYLDPATDDEKQLFKYGFTDNIYRPGLSAAIHAKFPDAPVPSADSTIAALKARVDKMEIKIEGDTAQLSMPKDAEKNAPTPPPGLEEKPFILKKVGQTWKLTVTESRFLKIPAHEPKELVKARAEATAQITKNVLAGKYPTFKDCTRDIAQQMTALQKQYAADAASRPAPASQPAPK